MLPPPLAALPSKRWTVISLFAHSYSVGVMAVALSDLLAEYGGFDDAPEGLEAFLLGFLHDFAGKLAGSVSPERVSGYVWGKLRSMREAGLVDFPSGVLRSLVKSIHVNLLEQCGSRTLRSPGYEEAYINVLCLSDILQGSETPFEVVMHLKRRLDGLGIKVGYTFYTVSTPHPMVRLLIGRYLHGEMRDIDVVVSTTSGMVVIYPEDEGPPVERIGWRDLLRSGGLLSEELRDKMVEALGNCNSGRTKKYCEKPRARGKVVELNDPEVILGYLDAEGEETPVLPLAYRDMVGGVELDGVSYSSGGMICPVCGVSHSAGIRVSSYASLAEGRSLGSKSGLAKEVWNRRFPAVNLNRLLQSETGKREAYRVCPLCTLDMLLATYVNMWSSRRRMYYTVSFTAPMPAEALEDLAFVAYRLATIFEEERRGWSLEDYLDPWKVLGESVGGGVYTADLVGSSIYVSARVDERRDGVDVAVHSLKLAGLLASYGLYPLTVDRVFHPHKNSLLVSYRVMGTLYSFDPSREMAGGSLGYRASPYVASVLLALESYAHRMERRDKRPPSSPEGLLGYPPGLADLLLAHVSPELYSRLEALERELRVGSVGGDGLGGNG